MAQHGIRGDDPNLRPLELGPTGPIRGPADGQGLGAFGPTREVTVSFSTARHKKQEAARVNRKTAQLDAAASEQARHNVTLTPEETISLDLRAKANRVAEAANHPLNNDGSDPLFTRRRWIRNAEGKWCPAAPQ